MAGLGKHQHRRGHPRVGLEHSAGHGNHRLQTVVLHDFFPDRLVRRGRAEQHPVRHDAGAPAAHFQHPQKQRQKQKLGLFGLAQFEQVRRNNVGVQAAFEGRIGQNQRIGFPVGVLVRKTVPVLDGRVVDAMGHHVHGADAQHRAVHIVAVEHPVHVMVFFLPVKEDLLFVFLFQVVPGLHQKAARAAGRVADDLVGLGGHHLHHHTDDMPRRAELAVHPRGGQLGKQIFVNVTPHIGAAGLAGLLINLIHRRDHLVQHQRRGNLENRIPHVLGVGAVLVAVQPLDEGKHPFLHHRVHLLRRKVPEHRPFQLLARNAPLPDGDLVRKNALVGHPQHGALLGALVVRRVQIMNEHQIGHLLHHVQRIGDAPGPECLPQAVDFILQFVVQHTVLLVWILRKRAAPSPRRCGACLCFWRHPAPRPTARRNRI